MFIVSGCDASELFDLIEEALHEVPLPIDSARENEGPFRSSAGCWLRPSLGGLGPGGITVVALVSQQDISLAELVRQCVGLSAVGDLTAGQTQADGRSRRRARGFCS